MSTKTQKASFAASALAAAAIAALLAWLFSFQSTLGLFEWQPPWRRNFILIGAAGLLPALASALGALAFKGRARLARGMAIAGIALAALALAIGGALLDFVSTAIAAPKEPVPALRLVDVGGGIPGSGGAVRLSLSSDPHWGAEDSSPAARRAILAAVASASPRRDAFVCLGDNVERGMSEPSWRAEAADLALLGPIPFLPLLGNHDGVVGGERHFLRYFGPSATGPSDHPFYYAFPAGPAEVVVLELLWGVESFSAAQAAWLERTLAALPPGRQVVVLSHAYAYASGSKDEFGLPYYDDPRAIARIAPVLERHKVALMVSGHNHLMELLRKDGVAYAIVGAMGGLPDPEPEYRSPASVWLKRGSFGRLDLDIDAKGIALAFRDEGGAALYEDFIPAQEP